MLSMLDRLTWMLKLKTSKQFQSIDVIRTFFVWISIHLLGIFLLMRRQVQQPRDDEL